MSREQRYVSRELTHFIGRGLSEEEQYLLLMSILSSGWLTYPPHIPPFEQGEAMGLEIDLRGRISANEMYFPRSVCFCDIPVIDLPLHMNKYSRFGVAFQKSFLLKKGANPVFYIASNSVVGNDILGYNNRVTDFDNNMDIYHSILR